MGEGGGGAWSIRGLVAYDSEPSEPKVHPIQVLPALCNPIPNIGLSYLTRNNVTHSTTSYPSIHLD